MKKYLAASALALAMLMQSAVGSCADFILDPGHSQAAPGAKSCSGAYEYAYNDALAAVVANYLQAGRIQADLSRKPGEEKSLTARAALSEGKKLFISLHHDSMQPQFITQVNGNPCSNYAQGYSIFVSSKNPFYQQSLAYAHRLGQELERRGFKPSRHHGENIPGENRKLLDERYGIYLFDDLIVLKQAKSPALLLEAAVIVNPVDEQRAATDNYRIAVADAIYNVLAR